MDDAAIRAHTHAHMLYDANRKSTAAAYVLWFILGPFGAHRFYLGMSGTGVTQLLLLLFGWLPMFAGWALLIAWLVIDLFLIPGIVRNENVRLANFYSSAPARL